MSPPCSLPARPIDVADIQAVQELYHANGWTDGLPIVPPTQDAVQACLEWAMMPPDQLLGIEPVRGVAITAEKLAINAVMAGCLPMHFPVVVTAFAAMLRAGIPAARRDRLHRRLRRVRGAERPDPPRTRRRGLVQCAWQQRPRHGGDRPRDPPRTDQHSGGAARRHRPFHARPSRASSATAWPRTRRTPAGCRCTRSAGCRRRCPRSPSWRPARRGRS